MGTEHFDDRAATWDDDPDKARRAQDVARAVAAAVPPREQTRLLEYGAGTGLVTQALAELVTGLIPTLADNSSGMRAVMEEKVAVGALPEGTRIWALDLEHDAAPEDRFDLVVSSLVMHHVRDLGTVLAGFATLLDEGGALCIADLDREDGSFHDHVPDFDGHHGFDRPDLAMTMKHAGFGDITITDATQIDREDGTYSVFLAVGTKLA